MGTAFLNRVLCGVSFCFEVFPKEQTRIEANIFVHIDYLQQYDLML